MNAERKQERLVVVDRVDHGILAASGDAEVLIVVFARDWNEVDRARAMVRARGLEKRFRVHHHLARICAKVA